MSKKAVILHSGGLDSTACLLLALQKKREVLSLGIDYGQYSRAELEYAAKLRERFKVARKVLNIEWDKPDRIIPENRIRNGGPCIVAARNGAPGIGSRVFNQGVAGDDRPRVTAKDPAAIIAGRVSKNHIID